MEAITVSKETWHYRFVAWFRRRNFEYMPDDICGYIRAFAAASLQAFLMALLAALVVAAFGDLFAWLVASVVNGSFLPQGFGAGVITGLVVAALVLAAIGVLNHVIKERSPEFARHAYRSIKDRRLLPSGVPMMKRIQPSGYVTAEQSRKPGYLAKKFAAIQSKNQRIRDAADAQNVKNLREAHEKVSALPGRVFPKAAA